MMQMGDDMFARVTHYKMKAASFDEAVAMVEDLKDRIMALPGIIQFINVGNSDGSGYVISLVESKEISDANQSEAMAIWGQFADHLEAKPVPEGYEVIQNWSS